MTFKHPRLTASVGSKMWPILHISIFTVLISLSSCDVFLFPSDSPDHNNNNGFNGQITHYPHQNPTTFTIPHISSTSSHSQNSNNVIFSERVHNPPAGFRSLQPPSCNPINSNEPCELDQEYDVNIEKKFEEILQRSSVNNIVHNDIYQSLLNDTLTPDGSTVNKNNVMTRFGLNIEETPACVSTETIIYPRRGKTANNEWAFILNQGSVKQGVKAEKCYRGEGSSCDLGGGSTSTIKSVCRQKYIYRKMLVMDSSGSNIIPESVIMPSCCVCYIVRSENNVEPRIKNVTTTPSISGSPISFIDTPVQNNQNHPRRPSSVHRNQQHRPLFGQHPFINGRTFSGRGGPNFANGHNQNFNG